MLPARAAPLCGSWTFADAAPQPQTFLRANFPVSETWTAAVWTWKCPRESRPATRRRERREQRWTPQADPVGISRRVSPWHSSADLGVRRERERETASRLQRSSLRSV